MRIRTTASLLFLLIRIRCCMGFAARPDNRIRVAPQLTKKLQAHKKQRSISHRQANRHRHVSSLAFSPTPVELNNDGEENDNNNNNKRPSWALDWMPTWLITMRPLYQLLVTLAIYVLHLTVLTQHSICFPFQLIPNSLGHFTTLGLDSVAGMLSLIGYMFLRRTNAVPSLWKAPLRNETPWRFSHKRTQITKTTSIMALVGLIYGYFLTGRCSIFWEDLLYTAAAAGFKMTIPLHRSLVVLLGHLTWIGIGGLILTLVPRPQPFFGGAFIVKSNGSDDDGKKKKKLRKYRWSTSKWNTFWMPWVVGGYFLSSYVFNLADYCNQMLLPHSLFDTAASGVVSQLINPEFNDMLASLIGCLAPCFTAPWWEEVLYRGFMLPALSQLLPFWMAVWTSGVIFSIHHVSPTGAIPLMVLGWFWAALYTKSSNLFVTIMVHSMWNSRVFLGNWLGL